MPRNQPLLVMWNRSLHLGGPRGEKKREQRNTSKQRPKMAAPLHIGRVKHVKPRRNRKLARSKPYFVEESKPYARSGHRAVADNANLYIFGGYNPDLFEDHFEEDDACNPLFKELWCYNFASGLWTEVETSGHMPEELASMSMLISGNTILVYGGTGFPFGQASSNNLYALNVKTKVWSTIKCSGDAPIPTYGQSTALVDCSLYVQGGTTGWQYNSDVHRLNLQTREWERLFDTEAEIERLIKTRGTLLNRELPIPEPRYRHEMATDGKRLYILGGGTSWSVYPLDKVHSFNFETNRWEIIQTKASYMGYFPPPRRCHSCVQQGNDVYICGGYDEHRIFGDIWKLTLDNLRWSRLRARLPEPVYFHAAAITPAGCMYIHGGVTSIYGDERTAELYRVWLYVPTLLEICWQKMISVIPQLDRLPYDKLLSLGIPRQLIERIQRQ
ncbi:kelch domain-containing protein 10-like [Saccoglossus kowalevskii]|uniref:Kelch domain-containing protein 10-like n=1 Tax=Saccoglossus kowalevskii TaxID=10224 RepID=A0ABM0H016_SACKO|nr:PREDICTED: kelch domain-containing protein 10-like [Saccoglossus kowalevskii]